MRLRLFFYAALCLAALPGCLSVEIATTADRRGGGERAYRISVDPAVASMYDSSAGTTKVLALPGDGLEKQPGVQLLSRTQAKDSGGGLLVDKRYRASRLDNASSAGDSIRYTLEPQGLWVYYRYREHYLANPSDSAQSTSTTAERYRFRHRLKLPGQLVTSNADSISAAGEAVWSRPMGQVRAAGLVMTAASRELNPLLWELLFAIAAVIGVVTIILRMRPTDAEQ